jgi:hypothetical protein
MEKIWVKELRMFISDKQQLIDLGYKEGEETKKNSLQSKSLRELNALAKSLGKTRSRSKTDAINKIKNA